MTIYCELQLERIRIKIDGEELAFQATRGFYESKMSKEALVSQNIRGYVHYHKTGLSLLERMQNKVGGNKAYFLVNPEVRELVPMKSINEFAAKYMNARSVHIMPKPATFDSTQLETMTNIRTEYIDARAHREPAPAGSRPVSATGK